MKTKKEHLLDIISHYSGWIVSTNSFLEDNQSREDISQEKKDHLEGYYRNQISDYKAKIEIMKSVLEGEQDGQR